RTQAVYTRRASEKNGSDGLGILDSAAIEKVKAEAWPTASNADELHDALMLVGLMTPEELDRSASENPEQFFSALVANTRAPRCLCAQSIQMAVRFWRAALPRRFRTATQLPKGAGAPAHSKTLTQLGCLILLRNGYRCFVRSTPKPQLCLNWCYPIHFAEKLGNALMRFAN